MKYIQSSDVYGIKSDFIVEGRNNKVFIKCKVHGSEKGLVKK